MRVHFTDSVLRAYYYKYSHPKEALVDHGLLNRGLLRLVDTIHNAYSVSQEPRVQGTFDSTSIDTGKIDSNTGSESESESLCFLYPFGATLNVAAPAIALLSTGSTCIPANRPICALHRSASSSGDSGALLVLGSVHMFSDSYVMLEQNQLTLEMLMQTLLQPQLPLNTVDALNPELNEYHNLPEVALLANRPIGCMHESEPLPADISKLILAPSTRSLSWINTSAATSIGNNQRSLFQFDNAGYWSVLNTYDQLQVDHEPLRLIRPMFEAPLPPLQPAVLAPAFRGLHRPALELFDLESEFSSVQSRLAQLAAECTDDHISYFLAECGRLFGLPHTSQPKLMLEQVFKQIIQYKKIS